MKTPTRAVVTLLLFYLVFFAVVFQSSPDLPARVATHFDGAGRPNGWMSRSSHILFMLIFGSAFPLFIIATCAAARFLPVWMVNIPNRAYWLAPERRRDTARYLMHHALWLGCATVALMTGVQLLVVNANARSPVELSTAGILSVVGVFLAATGLWAIHLLRHFKKPAAS